MDRCRPLERDGLWQGERMLLRALRLLALEVSCHSLKPQFENACGCAGAEAYRAVEVFVQQLRATGRRRIGLGPPAGRVTDDEALILGAFASAQADDYRALDQRLSGLVAGEPPAALGAAACLVGQVFAMNGLVLRAA
jgi:hypothetical protein